MPIIVFDKVMKKEIHSRGAREIPCFVHADVDTLVKN